jgi:tetratricopeptide (TPR) repeat protein
VLPDEPHLWIALAGEQQQHRDGKAKALATLKEAESNNLGSVSIAAAIATLYTQMGNPEQALTYYDKVLKFVQGNVAALNNQAMLYADDLNAPDKAVALAEQAHRLASSHPAVIDTLGWALYRRAGKGDIARARVLLESVRNTLTSPTSKYHLGVVLIASGAPEAGKQLLRTALAMSDDFAEAAAAQQALRTAQ